MAFLAVFLFFQPIGYTYRTELRSLAAAEVNEAVVSEITWRDGKRVTLSYSYLDQQRTAELLRLLAEARLQALNHPVKTRVWDVRFLAKSRVFESLISSTVNQGTIIELFSDAGPSGWNYGTLRNDQLRPWLARLNGDSVTDKR